MTTNPHLARPAAKLTLCCALIGATLSLSGCFPLAATGVVVGTLAAVDRRTLGAQTDDTGIELKALADLNSQVPGSGGVGVTSYNRKVLLSGQVLNEQTKRSAEALVKGYANVRSTHNELVVSGRVSVGTQAADTSITARVKTALINAQDLQANTIKVVTEAGVVYLMGIVTRAEGDRAAQVVSRVSGVTRVVTVFEYASADEMARIERATKDAPK